MKVLLITACLLLAYFESAEPTYSQCDPDLANLVIGTCLNSLTEYSLARTARQAQRGCRGAYASVSCMEDYILACNGTMSSLEGALVQLRKLRESRLKLNRVCHRKLETCY